LVFRTGFYYQSAVAEYQHIIANTCPVIEGGSTNVKDLKAGSYKLEKFCIEPTSFTVKEDSQFKGGDSEFVKTKLMTRLTYTLDAMSGSFKIDGSGNVELKEEDGIDYAPVTVQLPGGGRVPGSRPSPRPCGGLRPQPPCGGGGEDRG